MVLLALAAACQGSPPVRPATASCQHGDAAALLQALEPGALYQALRAAGPPPRCQASGDADTTVLVLQFGAAGGLRARRTAAIEATEWEAQFTAAPAPAQAQLLLRRTEQDALGPSGCGINWARPAASSVGGWVWQGSACQCRAEMQPGPAGSLVLRWRSAC